MCNTIICFLQQIPFFRSMLTIIYALALISCVHRILCAVCLFRNNYKSLQSHVTATIRKVRSETVKQCTFFIEHYNIRQSEILLHTSENLTFIFVFKASVKKSNF